MANVYDYLRWRGDLTFEERPFNDVDNLLLSTLVYLDFSGIVPSEGDGGNLCLSDACHALIRKGHGDVTPFSRSLAKINTLLVELLADSRRFGPVLLSAYEDMVDDSRDLQFAAFQADLPHAGTYVAFRGTDTTMIGWRENFMLSFTVTEAQREAMRYLERAIIRVDQPNRSIRVGGHSKGGNLAEYAAANCPQHLRQRIVRVYSNDGPGMAPEVTPVDTHEVLGDTLRHIVPAYSVIGMLFARKTERRIIVPSSAQGIDQHNLTTWQVTRSGVEEVPELQPECMVLNHAIAKWADGIALDERERVIKDVFDALEASGATTFEQIAATPDSLQRVVNALRTTDRHTREVAMALMQCTVDSSVGAMRQTAKRTLEDVGRYLFGQKPVRAGIVRRAKGKPGLKVYVDTNPK